MSYNSIHEIANMVEDELGVSVEMTDGAYKATVSRAAWDEEVESEFEWLQDEYFVDVRVKNLGEEEVLFYFGHPE